MISYRHIPRTVGGGERFGQAHKFGTGDDTVGNPRRAQMYQFELFELILLLKLDKHFPVEQFEATVSQSTVPFPPLRNQKATSV